MTYVLVGCQLILTGVLFMAALGKVLHPEQFMNALRESAVPKVLTYPVALLIVMLEGVLAISLTFSTSWSLPFACIGTLVLLGAFTGWLALVYFRKLPIQCGCFGASTSNVSAGSIVRNLILMGVSALGFFLALHTNSIFPSPSMWVLVAGFVLVGSAILLMIRRLQESQRVSRSVATSSVA